MGLGKLLALGAAAAGAALYMKKNNVNVKDAGKQMMNTVKFNVKSDEKYSNGAALTPPMGWSSWNTFRNHIDEKLILETAKAMRDSGLLDAGYCYLNLDDCWQSSLRDSEGKLQGDFQKFPRGIKALVEDINSYGLKAGIYSSNGTLTCEDLPASLGNEAIDADTVAEWGIEYFKYDFCHNVPIPFRAPCIEKIVISREGSEDGQEYSCEDAVLSGAARLVEDEKVGTGKYIAGLSMNGGSAQFEGIKADSDGEYILTLVMRKKSNSNKFAKILVNGEDMFETTIPPTRALSSTGRHQVKIRLKEGENTIKIFNPIASRHDSSATQYRNMGKELIRAAEEYADKTGQPVKPIVYSICEWGLNLPWRWGRSAGNLWRTTMDIKPFWASVLGIYEINVKLAKYAEPGCWNDPDMLEVGNGNLTYEENKAHFSLWCMMAAPLILGNDVRKFVKEDSSPDSDNEVLKIVTNKDLIAIDQDPIGEQCRRYSTDIVSDILAKKLENGEMALCFFNKSGETKRMEADLEDIAEKGFGGLVEASEYEITELWDKTVEVVSSDVAADVPSHGVKVYRVRPLIDD